MAACFLLNFFIMMPPPIDILKGLVPSVPNVPEGQGNGPFLVIASMVGTTVFSGLFIIRTTLVKEAGWTVADIGKQRNDAIVSVVMMFVISASIMAAAAGTLCRRLKIIAKIRAFLILHKLGLLLAAFMMCIFIVKTAI